MKSFKPLVCATSFALCSVVASMASAVTISPEGPFTTDPGSIVVKSPSSFGAAVTCGITFTGRVIGGVAMIYTVNTTGSGLCFMQPVVIVSPWVLTAESLTTGTMTNVIYKIPFVPTTNCGPTTIQLSWDPATKALSSANQSLSGNCTVVSLRVGAPTLTVNP
ncbi:protein activator of alkane oxidation PraB [Pseudomonas sp. WS 5411]|uniref:alkane oxidation protein activator PraB n=1 Tax=Pseudomonas sp. WS 5411 TaxID=2717486 RepID=UPI0014756C87|nr:alkane oxidation protein activator PraB [Pseudomonas sp. WS 5411]NMY86926.1 protein activator of alkane oxidation PraB [Pseudomonas sp. WS 5411]